MDGDKRWKLENLVEKWSCWPGDTHEYAEDSETKEMVSFGEILAELRRVTTEKRGCVWFDAGFAPPVRPGDMKRFLVTVANLHGSPFVTVGCYGDKVIDALDEEFTGWFQDVDDEYAPPLKGVLAWAHLPAPFLAASNDATEPELSPLAASIKADLDGFCEHLESGGTVEDYGTPETNRLRRLPE